MPLVTLYKDSVTRFDFRFFVMNQFLILLYIPFGSNIAKIFALNVIVRLITGVEDTGDKLFVDTAMIPCTEFRVNAS